LSEVDMRLNSSRKVGDSPRGKSHRQTEAKTTVGLYLPKTLVEKAKKNKLNLSRILEEALNSILNYMEAQNNRTSQTESSKFLGEASFLKEGSPRWPSLVGHRLGKAVVAGSNPAREPLGGREASRFEPALPL
jgi:post-segregation antitoxin (ccd killing protein)